MPGLKISKKGLPMRESRLQAYSTALDLVVSCEKHLMNELLRDAANHLESPAVSKAHHGLKRAIAAIESLELSFEIADAEYWQNERGATR
jgi:hypothetical protein